MDIGNYPLQWDKEEAPEAYNLTRGHVYENTLRKPMTPRHTPGFVANTDSALIWNRRQFQSASINPALIRLMLLL